MLEDELFTQNQAVMYVVINFAVATILLVTVNTNINTLACAPVMKQWLLSLALILSAGSLLTVYGIDIRYKSQVHQTLFNYAKIL
jgi:heme O synthase-like polyprenyltransferase